MKYIFSKLFIIVPVLFIAFLFSPEDAAATDGYEIKFKITGLQDSLIRIGYYFGDDKLAFDSVKLDHNGRGVLKGDKNLEGGIYLVVVPNKSYFEFLVNDQKFSIETDTTDYYGKMKITGSPDNILFRDYQLFMLKSEKTIKELSARLDKNKDKTDSSAALKEKIATISKEVKDYRLKLTDNHDSKLFLPVVMRAMSEPEIPEAPKNPDGSKDSTFAYKYFKKHFFDNVDFCNPGLIRTPVLMSKIKQYTNSLTVQDPDSIIVSVDTIIEKSKCNKEVFKYCLTSLTHDYEVSQYMGYDKIFVYLCEKYYLTDLAYWADATLKANIDTAVWKIKPNLIGVQGYNLEMQDTNGVTHSLYDVKAKYTVVAFYDPTCHHCQAEIPKLAQLYDSVKVNGVAVYAVCIESDRVEWKKFINEHKLSWLNVTDMTGKSLYHAYYNVYMKPMIYLLDENKKIIAKHLDSDGLRGFLRHQMSKK